MDIKTFTYNEVTFFFFKEIHVNNSPFNFNEKDHFSNHLNKNIRAFVAKSLSNHDSRNKLKKPSISFN
jgi:hypothetical protein